MEEKRMKKIILTLVIMGILLSIGMVEAAPLYSPDIQTIYTGESYLKTYLVNQEPYIAEPGSYVNLLFKIENFGTEDAKNVVFELFEDYPFSLDSGTENTQDVGTILGVQKDDSAVFLKYKVRVDELALEGENEIRVRTTYGDGTNDNEFDITISDPKTDFEIISQDSSSTTTFAIANIGEYDAYSVIVRIPEQDSFQISEASASIVGNLDAGDYTITSFNIQQKTKSEKNLDVEISYTDILGIRRIVEKQIPLKISGYATGMTRDQTSKTNGVEDFSSMTYIVVGIVGIVVIVTVIKFGGRKKK